MSKVVSNMEVKKNYISNENRIYIFNNMLLNVFYLFYRHLFCNLKLCFGRY